MTDPRGNIGTVQPVVRVAPLGELRVYQISEAELDRLASGGPDSLLLTLATFFLSSFISFGITLATTTIADDRLYHTFGIVCLVSAIAAFVLGILWGRNRVSSRQLVKDIKNRMPPAPGVQERLPS